MHVILLFVIIFTLILCWQADVFDGVTWGQTWVPFSLYLSCLWCHFLVLFLSHPNSSSSRSVNSDYYWVFTVFLNGKLLHLSVPFRVKLRGDNSLTVLSSVPPLLSFYTSPVKCTVFCGLCIPLCPLWFRKQETHPINTHTPPLLFLCLRYHQYQHHHWGHCRLHPLPRPHTGCYSLVLQVSASAACTPEVSYGNRTERKCIVLSIALSFTSILYLQCFALFSGLMDNTIV